MRVKAFVTKYAYWLFLAGLSALLCGACFTAELQRVILIYIAICAVLFTPEQLLGTLFFINCFDGLMLNDVFIHYYLLSLLGGHYLYNFIIRRQQVSMKLALVTVTFCLFILLRAWPLDYYTVVIVFNFLMFWWVYEQRAKFNFTNLLKVLAVGLIVSGLYGLLYYVSPYLKSIFSFLPAEYGSMEPYAHDYYRFQGVTCWATQYAGLAVVVLCGLLLAKYQKRLNTYWFYALFVPVFIFAYQTLTRVFLLCMVVALIIFAVMVLLRDRWQAWRTLVPLAGVLLAVVVTFFTATMGNLERIFHDNAMEGSPWEVLGITDEEWGDLKNGDSTYYDILGRRVIWSLYASDFVSSVTNLLLGEGTAHVLFAGHTPHNWYLFMAWKYGFVGVALFVMMLALMVNWRDWRSKRFWTRLAPCLIFVVPLLLHGVFDDNGHWAQIGIVFLLAWEREQPRLAVA